MFKVTITNIVLWTAILIAIAIILSILGYRFYKKKVKKTVEEGLNSTSQELLKFLKAISDSQSNQNEVFYNVWFKMRNKSYLLPAGLITPSKVYLFTDIISSSKEISVNEEGAITYESGKPCKLFNLKHMLKIKKLFLKSTLLNNNDIQIIILNKKFSNIDRFALEMKPSVFIAQNFDTEGKLDVEAIKSFVEVKNTLKVKNTIKGIQKSLKGK